MTPRTTATGTIASGASLSGAIPLGGYPGTVCAILMPASWTSASLTFQGSADGTTYGNIYKVGSDGAASEFTITSPVAGTWIVLMPGDLPSVNYFKIRSGTAGSPVTQGADRILTVVVLPL